MIVRLVVNLFQSKNFTCFEREYFYQSYCKVLTYAISHYNEVCNQTLSKITMNNYFTWLQTTHDCGYCLDIDPRLEQLDYGWTMVSPVLTKPYVLVSHLHHYFHALSMLNSHIYFIFVNACWAPGPLIEPVTWQFDVLSRFWNNFLSGHISIYGLEIF